jgi:hypothetical protein
MHMYVVGDLLDQVYIAEGRGRGTCTCAYVTLKSRQSNLMLRLKRTYRR